MERIQRHIYTIHNIFLSFELIIFKTVLKANAT